LRYPRSSALAKNPGLVGDDDRSLAQLLREGPDVLEDGVLRDDGPDHLDELLDGGRVEEVHAVNALGVRRGNGDLGNRQRGGVRRQDRVLRDDPVDPREDLLLQLEVLRHGLDHELAVGERRQPIEPRAEPQPQPPEEHGPVLGGQLPAAHGAGGGVLEDAPPPGHCGVVELDGHDLDPVAGEHSTMPTPIVPSPMTPTLVNSRDMSARTRRWSQWPARPSSTTWCLR